MQGLSDFIVSIFDYIIALFGIDFTNYSGSLPVEFINYYPYVLDFFKYTCLFYFLYLVFNFCYFLFSLGGIRKQ